MARKGRRRWLAYLIWAAVPLGAAALLWLFRFQILLGLGSWLIREDSRVSADAIVVLSGEPAERCRAGAALFREGLAPRIIATGSGVNPSLASLGIEIPDAVLGRRALMRLEIDSAAVTALPLGSSTFEEAQVLTGYAQQQGLKRVILVTSKFHTRRTGQVFRAVSEGSGITYTVLGAAPDEYRTDRWWESEKGLIFVNNEYLKLIWYRLTYGV
ncbi:MAG: YdcF family protein [Bacteroidia bacterium]|nr:YdcF family protein [Bacteroidia bacterium]